MKIRLQTAITFVAALWLLMLLVGCEADPVSRVQSSNNKNITVDFLFEHEGCRVYRFDDGDMRQVYYANCGAFAQTSWDRSCGKSCTVHETVSTSGYGKSKRKCLRSQPAL
jgi:hypothetical protein